MGIALHRGSAVTIRTDDKITTKEEFDLWINSFPYLCRDRLIWEIMFYCGPRLIEVCALQTFNFSNDYKTLEYFPHKKRNPRLRKVYLPNFLAEKIKEYVKILGSSVAVSGGYIFPSNGHGSKGKHVSAQSMRVMFQRQRAMLIKDKGYKFLKDTYQIVYNTITGKKEMFYRFAPHTFRAFYNTDIIHKISRLKQTNPEIDITDVALTAKEILCYEEINTMLGYHRLAMKDTIMQAIMLERNSK